MFNFWVGRFVKENQTSYIDRQYIVHRTQDISRQVLVDTAMRILEGLEYRLLHRLSKFDRSVYVNLKPISDIFGFYVAWFLIQKLMELVGGKFEFRLQLSCYNCISKNCKKIGRPLQTFPYTFGRLDYINHNSRKSELQISKKRSVGTQG